MVGEMRDQETAQIAVEASLTGHLVLSTLHTNSSVETIARLIEMGIDPYGFADSLLCIVGQRLGRSLCQECREQFVPSSRELDELVHEFGTEAFPTMGIDLTNIRLYKSVGCAKCADTGYHGRFVIQEILESNDILRRLIKDKADSDEIRKQAAAEGMMTMKQNGILRVFEGITDLNEVRRVCVN